jgi:hypothetical protein
MSSDKPRWAPGSLAEKVAHYVHTHEEIMAQADAVQRLTVAAREVIDGDLPGDEAWALFRAAVEAAEKWGGR